MAEIDTWMPWHVAEYLADTMHLSTLEHGAYLLLLAHGWRNDGMIAVNERVLAGVTRMTVDQWRTIKPTMERFFTSTNHPTLGPCWFQKRQVEEIRKAKENKAKAQEKSRKANAVRWSSSRNSSGDPPRNPQGVHEDSPQEGKGKDSSSPPENSARVEVSRPPAITQAHHDRARAVWEIYPIRSLRDGRAIRKDLASMNRLASKIAADPGFDWEDAARLEGLSDSPQDLGNWVTVQPDPLLLETRRKQEQTPPPLKPGERPRKTLRNLV